MTKSATRDEGTTSVLGDDNPAVRRVGNGRMAAMEALAGQRREAVAEESGVDIAAPSAEELKKARESADPDAQVDDDAYVDPNETAEAKAAAEEAARKQREDAAAEAERAKKAKAETEEQLRRQAASDERTVLDGDFSKYVIRTKVDGTQRDVPLDEAVREIQKGMAADKRLEDATRLKKEAEEELRKARSAGDQDEIRKAKAKEAEASAELEAARAKTREKVKAAADSLFAGDTDAATEALMEVVTSGRTEEGATPDLNQIVDVVTARIEQRAALKKFHKDYPELVASDHLADMVDARVRQLVDGGMPFSDALTDAGEHVRGQIKKLAEGYGMSVGAASTGRRVDRTSRKESIDEPHQARSAQASTTQEAPPSVSDVIAEMRNARMPQGRKPPA